MFPAYIVIKTATTIEYGHTHFVGGEYNYEDPITEANLNVFIIKWNKFVRKLGSQIVFVASSINCWDETEKEDREECWNYGEYEVMNTQWKFEAGAEEGKEGGKEKTFKDIIKDFDGSISIPFSNELIELNGEEKETTKLHSDKLVSNSLDAAASNLEGIITDHIDDLYEANSPEHRTLVLGATGASGTGKTFVIYGREVESNPDNLLQRFFDILIQTYKKKIEDDDSKQQLEIKLDFLLMHAWTNKDTIKKFIYKEKEEEKEKGTYYITSNEEKLTNEYDINVND